MTTLRPLSLHVSALNDAEYAFYTSSLNDLAVTGDSQSLPSKQLDDVHYENMTVGFRETRAWLRGRYAHVPVSDIDTIMSYFQTGDSLTGGQFFAALRLVIHTEDGKGFDRALAFVQAHPNGFYPAKPSRSSSPVQRKPSTRAPPIPPPHSRPLKHVNVNAAPSPDTNPFRNVHHDKLHPSAIDRDEESRETATPTRPPPAQKISHNPFLMRDKSNDVQGNSAPNLLNSEGKTPPLPPRKPLPLAAAPRQSLSTIPAPAAAPVFSKAFIGAPPVALKPSHITSPLMKQSLQASREAQNLKKAQELLNNERILRVIKTTSSDSSSQRTRSTSPTKNILNGSSGSDESVQQGPPLPRRRKVSIPSSITSSTASLEQVASATLSNKPFPSSPVPTKIPPALPSRESTNPPQSLPNVDTSPPQPSAPLPAPPTHPDRRFSVDEPESASPYTSSPRTFRSKSMHYASSAPPSRRKRPESVQFSSASSNTEVPLTPLSFQAHGRSPSFQGLPRHVSASARDTPESPMANLQRTFTTLQQKAQPKFDAVRYKAEAGLSKRGFVSHAPFGNGRWMDEGEESLMANNGRNDLSSDTRVDKDPYSEPVTDDEPSSGDEKFKFTPSTTGGRHADDADNLKWPTGEGWAQL